MKRLTCALAVAVAVVVVAGAKQAQTKSPELALTMQASLSLKPGEAAPVTVKIDHEGIDENVDVKFTDLPRGVMVDKPEQVVRKGEKGADFVLIALDNAEPGDHPVTVTVRSKEFEVTQPLLVMIRPNRRPLTRGECGRSALATHPCATPSRRSRTAQQRPDQGGHNEQRHADQDHRAGDAQPRAGARLHLPGERLPRHAGGQAQQDRQPE